jgi:gas vesicle protein
MKKTTKKIAIGTVVAAGAGYLAGILTAPKSGKETRKDIKVTTEKGIAAAEKVLKKTYTQLSEASAKAKVQVKKLSGTAKKDLQVAIDLADTAKKKAGEILSDFHEGKPQDKNLAKALSESQKAIDNLKTYLKKK